LVDASKANISGIITHVGITFLPTQVLVSYVGTINNIEGDRTGMGDPGRKPATTPDDVLEEFTDRDDRGEPLTAPELADRLNCSRRTALNKLHDLEDSQRVASKKVGGRSKVWWRPIPRDQNHRESGSPERADSGTESGTSGAQTGARDTDNAPPEAAHSDGFDRDTWLDRLSKRVDRNDEVAVTRADAILAMYDYLREHGEAEKGELKDTVDPDAVGYSSTDSAWSNLVKSKDTLGALPGVITPPAGTHDSWKYRPEESK
jgi:hypothetical protein